MSDMHDSPSDYSDFQKKGYPGKYISVTEVADGMTAYTGSNYGAAGFVVGTGSANIELVHGGTIEATQLIVGEFYPFSVTKISGGASAYIYVLKKNG